VISAKRMLALCWKGSKALTQGSRVTVFVHK
jgi:hypothetical protein